jgi:hypothetical protein
LAYLGNRPAESFASFEKQVFTIVNSQTAYTLSHSVTNENDIRLVVNNVVQEPGSGKAYTASGTTLTLSAALTNGTDTMYCVFLGRALQTVNAPNASVGSDQTAPTIITGQTAETSIATDDTILIHDTSASALRKMTRANFVSGIGGTNTPAFMAYLDNDVTISDAVSTLVPFNQKAFDTDNAFNTTNKRFVVPTAGKYFIHYNVTGGTDPSRLQYVGVFLKKNGTQIAHNTTDTRNAGFGFFFSVGQQLHLDLAVNDYLEVFVIIDPESSNSYGATIEAFNIYTTVFGGHKIIE